MRIQQRHIIKDTAIRSVYPNITTIDWEDWSCFDAQRNRVVIDQITVNSKITELNALEPLRLLRIERNRRLAETDWVVIRAYSQKQDVPEDWINYMQTLRDLPATQEPQLDDAGNLTNVTWPEVPE